QRVVACHLPLPPAEARQIAPVIANSTLAIEIALGVTRVAAIRRASACAHGFSRVFRYRRAPSADPLSGMTGCSTCVVVWRSGSRPRFAADVTSCGLHGRDAKNNRLHPLGLRAAPDRTGPQVCGRRRGQSFASYGAVSWFRLS